MWRRTFTREKSWPCGLCYQIALTPHLLGLFLWAVRTTRHEALTRAPAPGARSSARPADREPDARSPATQLLPSTNAIIQAALPSACFVRFVKNNRLSRFAGPSDDASHKRQTKPHRPTCSVQINNNQSPHPRSPGLTSGNASLEF